MQLNRLLLVVSLIAATLFSPIVQADAVSQVDVPKAFLADVDNHVLKSKVHKKAERQFQISVALPLSYKNSEQAYPVLYALDANGEFGLVAETARMLAMAGEIPELIVVGIGYPTGGRFLYSVKYRTLDYTPTKVPEEEKAEGLPDFLVPAGTGGAQKFLQFMRKQLIPFIEKEYRVKTDERVLLGHSLGGLFTTYALFRANGLFQRFVIGSPSLWWDDRVMFKKEKRYAKKYKALPVRAFFSAGSNDTDRIVAALKDFIAVLKERNYADFQWKSHFFENETHISVVPVTISRGLRSVYAK